MSSTQCLAIHARAATAPESTLPCHCLIVWFLSLRETDAALCVCSLGSGLNQYLDLSLDFGLRLCPHTGLPLQDTRLILSIFLNTVHSLRDGLLLPLASSWALPGSHTCPVEWTSCSVLAPVATLRLDGAPPRMSGPMSLVPHGPFWTALSHSGA